MKPPLVGSGTTGGEGANEEVPQLLGPVATNHEKQESKAREAEVIVSFGARSPVALSTRRLTTALVVDKARLCCLLFPRLKVPHLPGQRHGDAIPYYY